MALEDYLESEVGIAIAATAIVLSPRARSFLRRGVVYGLAGVLKVTDSVTSAARGVAGGVQQSASSGATAAKQTTAEARSVAKGNKSTASAASE